MTSTRDSSVSTGTSNPRPELPTLAAMAFGSLLAARGIPDVALRQGNQVVIDPLIPSSRTGQLVAGKPQLDADITDDASTDRHAVAWEEVFSASDHDLMGETRDGNGIRIHPIVFQINESGPNGGCIYPDVGGDPSSSPSSNTRLVLVPGSTLPVTIPPDSALLGVGFSVQGLALGSGPCIAALHLSDTLDITAR